MHSDICDRAVRLYTEHGTADGTLRVAAMLRTLDDLNIVTKGFINLHDASFEPPTWRFAAGAVSINRASVYFAIERESAPRGKSDSLGYTRAGARIQLGPYTVDGFVHVPPGGSPMARIHQDNHAFIAFTSASVTRGDEQFAAPFLAVNRAHILAAQELYASDASERPTSASGVVLE